MAHRRLRPKAEIDFLNLQSSNWPRKITGVFQDSCDLEYLSISSQDSNQSASVSKKAGEGTHSECPCEVTVCCCDKTPWPKHLRANKSWFRLGFQTKAQEHQQAWWQEEEAGTSIPNHKQEPERVNWKYVGAFKFQSLLPMPYSL